MNKEDIEEKLKQALEDIKKPNFIANFPVIVKHMHYIFFHYREEHKLLSPGEEFSTSSKFQSYIVKFCSEFVKQFYKARYDIDLEIEETNEYGMTMAAGGYDPKEDKIKYHPIGLVFGCLDDFSIVHMFLHEARHKMQYESFKSRNIEEVLQYPPHMILLLKDVIYSEYRKDKEERFYFNNYERLYYEIDAESSSLDLFCRIMTDCVSMYIRYCMDNGISKNEFVEGKAWEIEREFVRSKFQIEGKDKEVGRLNAMIMHEADGRGLISSPLKVDGEETDRLLEMDRCIKSHPELKEKYPLLGLIFNDDYTPKSYDQLMEEMKIAFTKFPPRKSATIAYLYRTIILSDPIYCLTDMVRKGNIKDVCGFLWVHPNVYRVYPKEVEDLLSGIDNITVREYLEKNRGMKKAD